MPVEGLSHQNVRTYYKGIKAFRADEKRGELDAGQWTADTQNALALAGALAEHPHDLTRAQAAFRQRRAVELRRPTGPALRDERRRRRRRSARAVVAPDRRASGGGSRVDPRPAHGRGRPSRRPRRRLRPATPASRAGQDPATLDGTAFLSAAADAARAAEKELEASGASGRVSQRLDLLAGRLFEVPLDLQDLCGDTGPAADEAFPFGLAMAGQRPRLAEASLLAAINVGGDANTVGAICGALLGAINGAGGFPAEWRDGVEASGEIVSAARALDEMG